MALGAIVDGTTNTLLFGEVSGSTEVRHSWMGCGSMPVAWGLPRFAESTMFQFGSGHVEVVQFVMADGSDRPLNRYTSMDVLRSAAGRHDGGIKNRE
jgi:hypothetical protein